MMSLAQIAKATSGKLSGQADLMIQGICIDSRQDCSERLFIAIEGDNFDGHNYVSQAKAAGASAVMLSREDAVASTPAIIVEDTIQGMAALTKSWRQRFSIPVVGITGSVGKTSLKEMIGNVLSIDKVGVVTEGNFNNEIGVPLTVSRLNASHEFAVVEMGMNHFGEIARLSEMTQPSIAVINNAAASHLENLGSIAGVAKAKGEIVTGLEDSGVLVVNGDDEFAEYWSSLAGNRRVVKFGLESSNDVTASFEFDETSTQMNVRYYEQEFDLRIPVIGKHNVMNALATVAVAKELLVDNIVLQQAFDRYTPPQNRSGRYAMENGVLIDDSYNANPASMKAAINQLALEQSLNEGIATILVVGDMAELGKDAADLHKEVGEAAQNNVDYLYAVGQFANSYRLGFGESANVFVDQAELIKALKQDITGIQEQAVPLRVLVKGSRSARMDKIVNALQCLLLQNEVTK